MRREREIANVLQMAAFAITENQISSIGSPTSNTLFPCCQNLLGIVISQGSDQLVLRLLPQDVDITPGRSACFLTRQLIQLLPVGDGDAIIPVGFGATTGDSQFPAFGRKILHQIWNPRAEFRFLPPL